MNTFEDGVEVVGGLVLIDDLDRDLPSLLTYEGCEGTRGHRPTQHTVQFTVFSNGKQHSAMQNSIQQWKTALVRCHVVIGRYFSLLLTAITIVII